MSAKASLWTAFSAGEQGLVGHTFLLSLPIGYWMNRARDWFIGKTNILRKNILFYNIYGFSVKNHLTIAGLSWYKILELVFTT